MEKNNGKEFTGVDFENKISELQDIVHTLEGDIPLEESMKLFENGIKLTKDCIDELNKAQDSINKLKSELDKILEVNDGE